MFSRRIDRDQQNKLSHKEADLHQLKSIFYAPTVSFCSSS